MCADVMYYCGKRGWLMRCYIEDKLSHPCGNRKPCMKKFHTQRYNFTTGDFDPEYRGITRYVGIETTLDMYTTIDYNGDPVEFSTRDLNEALCFASMMKV